MIVNSVTRSRINTHIQNRGYHLYIVSTDESPRYAYTIGLKERVGYELCFIGALFFDVNEVEDIFSNLICSINRDNSFADEVKTYGAVELLDVGSDWVAGLLFGALDFYDTKQITFKQIYLSQFSELIDVPNCSSPLNGSLWSNSQDSELKSYKAVVNKEVLNNEAVLEVMRWEQNEWEMFSYAGPDVPKDDLRIVPLKVCFLADKSLMDSLKLEVGKGSWREGRNKKWIAWG
jgi:hypothetical protein